MIVIFGAGGGLGQALVSHYLQRGEQVLGVSRQAAPTAQHGQWLQVNDYNARCLAPLYELLQNQVVDGVISTLGSLHDEQFMPEKRLDDLSTDHMLHSYYVNAVLPLSLLQWTKPYLPTKQPCFWVQLSAKVGSISDNQLGGWYSYRASKAALNMLLKTAAIELARSHKQLTIAAIHPGTTDTQLSKPFQGRLSADKLFTPAMSAARIAQVIDSLEPTVSGVLWHWDGTRLPY
jgi:NAD(P)-dependent dehydrogenase (short-subunit alcohol dehydrogenase family)